MKTELISAVVEAIAGVSFHLLADRASKNAQVRRLLEKFGINPKKSPIDFNSAYTYALIEYGLGKPKQLLEFFKAEEIKSAFHNTPHHPPVFGFVAGLGGKDIKPEQIEDVINYTAHYDYPEKETLWVDIDV